MNIFEPKNAGLVQMVFRNLRPSELAGPSFVWSDRLELVPVSNQLQGEMRWVSPEKLVVPNYSLGNKCNQDKCKRGCYLALWVKHVTVHHQPFWDIKKFVCLSSWSLVMRLLFCWDDASSRFYNSWSYDIMRSKFGRILAVMLMFDGFSVLRTLNIKGFRHGSTPLETSNQLAKLLVAGNPQPITRKSGGG